MKKGILMLFAILVAAHALQAQKESRLPRIFINKDVTTFFILSEPITVADISTGKVAGDQPAPNVLRIKPIAAGKEGSPFKPGNFQGVVTIIAQEYMVQYALIYASAEKADKNISVGSMDGISLKSAETTLSAPEMKKFCLKALQRKKGWAAAKSKAYRISARVNNIFTVGNYFFMDITFQNHSNIQYDIDQVRFKIADRLKTKRTNFQQIEIEEEFALYDRKVFRKKYRNVYVFKKFTFPNKKVFTVALTEDQISGRTLTLKIAYSDILKADTF